jgi:hypothetical protein
MNTEALLALLADLYAQIRAVTDENARLRVQLEQQAAEGNAKAK